MWAGRSASADFGGIGGPLLIGALLAYHLSAQHILYVAGDPHADCGIALSSCSAIGMGEKPQPNNEDVRAVHARYGAISAATKSMNNRARSGGVRPNA